VVRMPLRDLKSIITLEVLLTVCKKPGAFVREVIDTAGITGDSVIDAIDYLIEKGLIKEEREKSFPRRRYLFPTEKGKRIGELLEKIEEVLRD